MGDLVSATGSKALVTVAKDPEVVTTEEERKIKEAEELGEKLRQIQEAVPTRVYNVCGSSAGAGSGDFHQYRMIRRQEQMRVKRIEEEWEKTKEQQEFEKLQEARKLEADQRTAKRRSKRQKKKAKKHKSNAGDVGAANAGEGSGSEDGSDEEGQPKQVALD